MAVDVTFGVEDFDTRGRIEAEQMVSMAHLILVLLTGLSAFVVEGAQARLLPTAADSHFACARTTGRPLPKIAELSAQDRKSLSGCDAVGAYYGLSGGVIDLARARKCALLEREASWKSGSLSPGLLMMIFANGQGVAKNSDLAIRFVCESNLPSGEIAKWVTEIERLKSAREPSDALDYCDRIGEGPTEATCMKVRKGQQALSRARKFYSMARDYSTSQRQKLEKLLEIAARFFALDSAWRNGARLKGQNRVSFMHGHEAYAWEQLEMSLMRLEKQKTIRRSSELLVESDDRLNKRYRDLQSTLSTEDQAFLKTAQRTWIDYRDAYVDFAISRYSPRDNAIWQTELTQRRVDDMAF